MEKPYKPWLERGADWPAWIRYFLAFCIAIVCCVARISLDPWLGSGTQFITFYAGIVAAAYLLGTGPAVFCVLLSTIAADYCFLEPRHEFKINALVVLTE